MALTDIAILHKLGAGESIEAVRTEAGMSRDEFDRWWSEQLSARLPNMGGSRTLDQVGNVEIFRDGLGTPHIYAGSDQDLFFGYGFAMAQDRLWQMDYLRRKALGRLSEVLGPSGLGLDATARIVGINRIASEEVGRLPDKTKRRL